MLKTDKALYFVETQEDYDDLMVELEKLGVVWQGGDRPTTLNYWGKWREKTIIRVYNNKISWSDINYFLSENYRNYHFEVYRNNKVKLKSSEKFISDWYEEKKGDLEASIYSLIVESCFDGIADMRFLEWFNNVDNKPIQTLINMHQFGYELEQEKLYMVEFPDPNKKGECSHCLRKTEGDGRIVMQKVVE